MTKEQLRRQQRGQAIVALYSGEHLVSQQMHYDGAVYTGENYRSWRGRTIHRYADHTRFAQNVKGVNVQLD